MSLGFVVLLIAAVSTVIVSLLSCAKRPSGKFWFLLAALVVPFIVSNCIYWLTVPNGADAFEYLSWAPLLIIPCAIAGAIPSVAAVLFIRRPPSNSGVPGSQN